MRVLLRVLLPAQAGFCGVFGVAGVAAAADIEISGTNNSQQIVTTGDVLTVLDGATLSVAGNSGANSTAVRINGTSGTVTINNFGTIEQTGTVRAIRNQTSGITLNLNNGINGLITSSGDDVLKMASGTGYHIDNQGWIWQTGAGTESGQALDLRDSSLAGNTITNGSATNTAAVIRTDGDDAIRPGSNTTITNFGTIISFGAVNTSCPDYLEAQCDAADGPGAHDAIDIGENINVTVDNYGTISGPRHGITADEDVTVYNRAGGTIVGRNGSGVGSDGNGTVYNWGTIRGDYAGEGKVYDHLGDGSTTDNGDGDGVDIDNKAYIVNYGQILGTGAGGLDSGGNPNGGDGVAAGGGTILNAGLIGGEKNGILVDDGAGGGAKFVTHITNTGTIVGADGYGIRIDGSFDNTIDNSGSVAGGTEAIHTGSGDDTLTLRKGSKVTGLMELGGGRDTFNYLQGGNATFTFSNSAPEAVNAPGAVVVVNGNKVGIFDPSGKAASTAAFSNLVGGISDTVFGHIESAGPQGTATSGFAGAMNLGATQPRKKEAEVDRPVNAFAATAWGNAFGTWTRTDADGTLSATSSRVGGFAAGYDSAVSANTRAGVFLGGAYGTLNVDATGDETDATSVYGGLYAHRALSDVNVDAVLTLGASDHDSERTVTNNLAAGGVENVTGDYWSYFVNPVVGVSTRGGPLLAAARVGYAGAWTEGYTEDGAAGAMSVDSQSVHLFHARAEVKVPMTFSAINGVAYVVAPFAGVRGYTQVGDTDITGSIVGADFSFDPGSDRSVGTAFAGVNAAVALGEQGQAFLDVEGGRRTDDTDELKARAGVRWSW
jgi:uncharacterized protein with beta-barrel porin domain